MCALYDDDALKSVAGVGVHNDCPTCTLECIYFTCCVVHVLVLALTSTCNTVRMQASLNQN